MAIKTFFLFVMRTFFHRICQEGFVYNSIKDIECFCCCWFSVKLVINGRRWRRKKRKRLLKIDSVCIFQMNLNILIPCLTVFLWHLIFFLQLHWLLNWFYLFLNDSYRKIFHIFLHDFVPIWLFFSKNGALSSSFIDFFDSGVFFYFFKCFFMF